MVSQPQRGLTAPLQDPGLALRLTTSPLIDPGSGHQHSQTSFSLTSLLLVRLTKDRLKLHLRVVARSSGFGALDSSVEERMETMVLEDMAGPFRSPWQVSSMVQIKVAGSLPTPLSGM